MRFFLTLAISALTLPASAQTIDTRPGDTLILATDLDERIRGQRLTFFDNGQSHFYNDGRYTYAYDLGRGGYAYGFFEVTSDSTICIAYLNGFSRCDVYVENNGRLVLITDEGDRFPIRDEVDAGPDPAIE